ncbi:AI-2E family transporter [Microcoleus sp. FACHB-1515]|uniref:AI-2E family transporter n=1 Tax=Cyanophyceae TaxID=3028117 RepID=UPI001686B266|nr:AI-2E family transporter [Microcoleus sp. FACHB-1515]MBD2093491.1 AI-2E family transporter [Microcoleus sp. FACHB-1515]
MTLGRWLGLAAILIALYVLWQIRSLLLLFYMAVVFAVGLNRIVRQFRQSGLKRGFAVAFTVVIVILIGGLFVALMAVRVADQLDQLIDLIPGAIAQIATLGDRLQAQIPSRMLEGLPNLTNLSIQIQRVANWIIINLYQTFSNSLALLLNGLLLIVLTLMLLANPKSYRNLLIRGSPAFYRDRVDFILTECESGLVHYLGGIGLSMAFIGITSTIGLLALGVPLPFVNGLIAGISAFVPYIGAIASVVPPALLALLISPWKAIAVLLLYFVIQQIEGNCITPIIMKRQVSLLPATTLAILTAFGSFFGVLGLFLGLPILVVAQIWLKEVLVKDILDQWNNPQFLDESGVNLKLTRTQGHAPIGQPVIDSVARNYGQNISILGALSTDGIVAAMTVQGSVDALVFALVGYSTEIVCRFFLSQSEGRGIIENFS